MEFAKKQEPKFKILPEEAKSEEARSEDAELECVKIEEVKSKPP